MCDLEWFSQIQSHTTVFITDIALLAFTHLVLTVHVPFCEYRPITSSHGPIGTTDFCLDHMINHRYLYVIGFAKTGPNRTRTEIQFTA